jgi:hypothetical protein
MPAIRGSLDILTSLNAQGWAFSPDTRNKLTVQVLLNHVIIGESIADIHRPDLAAVGMGDGNCGYNIAFYREVDPLYLPFVVAKLEGCDVDLPRAAIFGFSDYFAALYQTHPIAGRQRSVFGGFWTDRIDAAALLRDRVDIGMVTPEVGATLSGFIRSGFMILDASSPQVGAATSATGPKRNGYVPHAPSGVKTSDPAEAISSALRSKLVLSLLHPILEGHPLALSTGIVEGSQEGFRQASAMEALPSPNECLALVVPIEDRPVELDVIRDSHLFPEFSADGRSRWVHASSVVAIDIALRQHGMIDRYIIPPGSVAIVGPGLIHRVRTEPGAGALRVHCTPSRIAPLDRVLDGGRQEIALESGARLWI